MFPFPVDYGLSYTRADNLNRVESPPSAPLKPHLLLDPDDDQGLNQEFVLEALKRIEEDDSILPTFVTAVEEMSHDLSMITLDDDYHPYMMVRILQNTWLSIYMSNLSP